MTPFKTRSFSVWIVSFGLILLAGCIDMERWDIHFDIEDRHSVRVTHRLYGIHSSHESEEERLAEMKSFYESDHLIYAGDLAADWKMETPVVFLTNRTDLSCDAQVSGRYSSVLDAFSPLLEESDYIVTNNGSVMDVTIWMPEGDRPDTTEQMSIRISYPGPIIEHNAHVHLEDLKSLEWDLTLVDSAGIHFVIELPD